MKGITMPTFAPYAKFIVAILGAALTAALGVVAPSTDLWAILTIASAAVTAAGVYFVPNAAKPQ